MSKSTTRVYRREQGLCPFCGGLPEPGKVNCRSCLDKAKTAAAKRFYDRRKQGLCPYCGKRSPRSGTTTCQECHDRQHAVYLRHKAAGLLSGQQRRAKGLCAGCGKFNVPPHTVCESCRAAQRLRWLKIRMTTPQMQIVNRDEGKCQLCHWPKRLHVHHIDGQGKTSERPNDDPENLITLCHFCHIAITRLRQVPPEKRSLAVKLLLA